MQYVAFIHSETVDSYGISFPDVPGVVSAGDTLEEAIQNGADALAFALEDLQATDRPRPRSMAEIEADETLKEWRENATLRVISLLLDEDAVRRFA